MKTLTDGMGRALVGMLLLLATTCGSGGGGDDGGEAPPEDSGICDDLVTGVTVYDPEACDNGYTLFSSFGGHEVPPGLGIYYGALLVDMDGELVHEWPIAGFPVKMLPGGHVMGCRAAREDGTGHQEMDRLVELDWEGNEVWGWDGWAVDADGNPICRGHHDFQREGYPEAFFDPDQAVPEGDGRTLLLVHDNVDRPDINPNWTLEDDVILEVDREGEILWEWHASDHFEEFGFSEDAKRALRNSHVTMPELLGGGAQDITDWLHTNNISPLGPNRWWEEGDTRFNPENILADSRNANLLWIIEKSTGAVVWKVGPDYSAGNPEAALGQLVGQHHVHMIAEGLPGAGDILLFDNGGAAGYGSPRYPNKSRLYSRVIEFNPVTLELVWEYERPLPGPGERYPFFSYYISSAQRLPNGNTLIAEGSTGRLFEVTRSGKLVWEYLSPYHDISYDRMPEGPLQCETDIYRAYRIPYDYLPAGLIP